MSFISRPNLLTYTPQVDQGVTTNISKTVNYAKYQYLGPKLVIVTFSMRMSGSGTAGSGITVTLPLTALSAMINVIGGTGAWYNAGAVKVYVGVISFNSTTKIQFIEDAQTAGSYFGAVPNLAIGNNDVITGSLSYEIA